MAPSLSFRFAIALRLVCILCVITVHCDDAGQSTRQLKNAVERSNLIQSFVHLRHFYSALARVASSPTLAMRNSLQRLAKDVCRVPG